MHNDNSDNTINNDNMKNNNDNYWKFSPSSSNTPQYEDFKLPFKLNIGDEIRTNYSDNTFQDFTILGISYSESSYLNILAGSSKISFNGRNLNPASIYDKLTVFPDPSTLSIPNGIIKNFTIRRRSNTDNKVVLNMLAPTGSLGTLTPSGDGFIIPDDLSEIQKGNIDIIINQLTAKNAI